MINAFKQIRLTNVNISGQDGRLVVANSGNLAFTSELEAVSGVLASGIAANSSSGGEALAALSGLLSSGIEATGSSLDSRITSEVNSLNSGILATSGDLRTYIDDSISGVIDMAPDALNTLKELSAALGDDANFASNLTNTLTEISGSLLSGIESAQSSLSSEISSVSGSLASGIASTGSALQSQIDEISSTYVTLGTTQTISGDKTFSGDVTFAGGFEVGASEGSAALFVSGNSVGINTEAPTEALDVNGNVKVGGTLFVASGIDANNAVISNVGSPVNDGDAVNKAYVTGISGALQSSLSSATSALESGIAAASGVLDSKIDLASGFLQSGIDTKVASATQKQFSVLLPSGIESTGISFPGDAFSSAPSVVVTLEGDVIYSTLVKNRSVSGFDIFFSDLIQEENAYLNIFASNQ